MKTHTELMTVDRIEQNGGTTVAVTACGHGDLEVSFTWTEDMPETVTEGQLIRVHAEVPADEREAAAFYRDLVGGLLETEGIAIDFWGDSAGSYLRVHLGPKGLLQSDLEADGANYSWTTFSWLDDEGELVTNLEVQERPFGHACGGQAAASPAVMAAGIKRLVDVILK